MAALFLVVPCAMGQDGRPARKADPPTILWKITGPRCPQPSYLLGTFHLTGAEWLWDYPEMVSALDRTAYILTEAYTTKPAPPVAPKQPVLKALPLLDKKQFHTLDSFFVARVGEGIRDNQEAAAMTVPEMEGAILGTLLAQSHGANGITKLMDRDLFEHYVKLGREGDRLDRMADTDFDSTEVAQARQYLARAIRYIDNSDKADWNIYQMTGVENAAARYKQMEFDYQLHEYPAQVQHSTDYDFVPVEQRNRNWMPKIIAAITSKPTLIAVGLGHFFYKTGLIMLLRSEGYAVEPVLLHPR